jgi:hypothetical protein
LEKSIFVITKIYVNRWGEKCENLLKKLELVQHQLENRHDTRPVIEVTEIVNVTQKKGSSIHQNTVTDGQ